MSASSSTAPSISALASGTSPFATGSCDTSCLRMSVDGVPDGVVGFEVHQRGDVALAAVDDLGDDVVADPEEPEPGHPLVVEDPGEVAPAAVGDQDDHEVVGA